MYSYAGYYLRWISATSVIVDVKTEMMTLKRHTEGRSSSITESFVKERFETGNRRTNTSRRIQTLQSMIRHFIWFAIVLKMQQNVALIFIITM